MSDEGLAACHIRIRTVSARSDETSTESLGPVVGFDCLLEAGERRAEIWGERAVDVRFEFAQVDDDFVIVFGALVSC